MPIRGRIENIARRQQIIDFSGVRFGNITPTDIDGVIEYNDIAYAFYEIKYANAEMKYGQKLCLERLVNDMMKAGKKAIAMLIRHDIHDVNEQIPAHLCIVEKLYVGETWKIDKKHRTVWDLSVDFFTYVERARKIGA